MIYRLNSLCLYRTTANIEGKAGDETSEQHAGEKGPELVNLTTLMYNGIIVLIILDICLPLV